MANRLQDLLNALPRGKFYASEGEVLPFIDRPHQFEFRTSKPNRLFLLYINDVASGQTVTDAQGVGLVKTIPGLPPGNYRFKVVDPADNESRNFFATVKNIATWHAAYADVLNALDDDIDDMDRARSLSTVSPKYVEAVYGRTLRQPRPSLFRHEEYKNLLRQLRQAYRHFGAHPHGLNQAVEGFTSVSPQLIPKAWRPNWILGHQACPNGNLQERSRLSPVQFGPPGAVATSLVPELFNINRQSRYFVHPGVTGTVTTGFRAIPTAQRLSVTVPDANAVTLVGIDERGLPVSEVVPDPSITPVAGTYLSERSFDQVTSATKAGGAAQIGLGESRFVKVKRLGPYNDPGVAVTLGYYGYDFGPTHLFAWGSGDPTRTAIDFGSATLKDVNRSAFAIGTKEVAPAGTFNLNPAGSGDNRMFHDRLWLDIDDRGVICIHFAGSLLTPANIATLINLGLNNSPLYGALYNSVASVLTGNAGDNDQVVMLRAPYSFSATPGNPFKSRIKILGGPGDASVLLFGLPLSSTMLTVPAASSTLSCVDTKSMPDVSSLDPAPFRRRFKVRVHGRKTDVIGYLIDLNSIPVPGAFARLTCTPTYSFTEADVGGYVELSDDFFFANAGLHKIVDVVGGRAIIHHESASAGGNFQVALFSFNSTGTVVISGKSEVKTVVNNNKTTNTLTLDSAITYAWKAHSTVEMVDETPYKVDGTPGLGEVDIDIDGRYRPHHDFGDTISFVAGTTWRLTSARGNFTGLVGQALNVSGCVNIENNSPPLGFTLTAVTATTADFVNALGVPETSEFEWSIDYLPTAVSNNITPTGALMPDGWRVMSASTAVALGNCSSNSSLTTPGRLVPSRVRLSSVNPIVIQREVPEALAWRGVKLDVQFWVQEHTADSTEYKIEVSFDGTNFFQCGVKNDTLSSVLDVFNVRGPQKPFQVRGSFLVPYDAARCIIRFTRTPLVAATGYMTMEKMVLTSPTGTGLSCGDNTIPRTQKRAKFGELLYVWSAENLTAEEREYVGLPIAGTEVEGTSIGVSTTAKPGHIDYITNAHGYYNRVDISEVDQSGALPIRKNIRGVYDSVDWIDLESAGNLVRMDAVVGTPSRMSHVRPRRVTPELGETLVMIDAGDGPGIARANLSEESNHSGTFPQVPNTGTGTGARLYEIRPTDTTLLTDNGLLTFIPAGTPIPVPDMLDVNNVQPWEFTSASQIRINAPYFNNLATYLFDYDVLMRVTTRPFQVSALGSVPNDYVWFIDFAKWARHQVKESYRLRVEQATFGSDFTARLSERAAIDESATLERDNGLFTETVQFSDWSFADTKTLRINSSVFDPDSIYTISYMARVPSVKTNVKLDLEWRAANLQALLTANLVPWQKVENGKIISPYYDPLGVVDVTQNFVQPWHQLRVTISGVEDVRDLRLYGMGIRGVHLFGPNANAPGILTPGA